jgi:dTDP-3-amino-3,4,6-trideoxy-alpha-D-glucose transaminase
MSGARVRRQVPLLDLPALHEELQGELESAALRVMRSGRLLLGSELADFEESWAAAVDARFAVGVGSGLDALSLGLRALGVRPGDEVLVPSHTFIATWLAVFHVGAVPVPVDVRSCNADWDVEALEAAVTARTRAVVPVHLYGHPVDLEPILHFARTHDLFVLDDAAQAHGARLRGRPVGGLTHATAWSFYPGKNLGALGDGGAVTTSDPETARRLRSLRNYGSSEKYRHDDVGWNSRLDEIQAALLSVKLRRLDEHNARREAVARRYDVGLTGLGLVLPERAEWATPVWHLYVVHTPHRDALRDHLSACGVETGVHYPIPAHRQPAFAGTPLAQAHLPVADALARGVLSLPMGPHLPEGAQTQVIDAIRSFQP